MTSGFVKTDLSQTIGSENMSEDCGESTRSVHASADPEERTGSVQVPIFQTSTYVQHDFADHTGYEYSRSQNPTREVLEAALAEMESPDQPAYGSAFASGMAAITTVTQLLESGSHTIIRNLNMLICMTVILLRCKVTFKRSFNTVFSKVR